jgi:hypothetical protein
MLRGTMSFTSANTGASLPPINQTVEYRPDDIEQNLDIMAQVYGAIEDQQAYVDGVEITKDPYYSHSYGYGSTVMPASSKFTISFTVEITDPDFRIKIRAPQQP